MLLVLFTALLFTMWDIVWCTFEITFLSHMYDKTQIWSIRRGLKTAQKGSRSIVLLSDGDSGEIHQIHLFPACMWVVNANTWTSGFMHLGAAQVQAWVLGARRTSACSRRSDKQLEGVMLYFHHGQTHQLLSSPLQLLAHPTDNRLWSLVGRSFFFLMPITRLC